MAKIPQELIDYLHTMITPEGGTTIVSLDLNEVDWSQYKDQDVHGLIAMGNPEPHLDEIWRVLRPGAHIMLIAPDEEPTGHTGACALEDKGFEIRDAILLVQEAGRIHYVPKASTAERNAGVVPIKETKTMERAFLKSDADAKEIIDILREELEQDVLRRIEEVGIPPASVPEDFADSFEVREIELTITHSNNHPTVKSIGIMQRLMHDVPEDATVLDPFMGSGSTGIACLETGRNFIGIEREEPYIKIADARLRHWDTAKRRPWVAEIDSEAPQNEEPDDPFGGMFE